MRKIEFSRFTNNNKTAIVTGDGGSYVVEMYIDGNLIENKLFNEHTQRIVDEFANTWVQEDK